ncbi:ROK family protein [Chryseolinea lacunae]|uniref:ROK family protein n=1 Tax=Chryseolinea lacunae TaxID=2801331 RepID=A0ABS1KJY6_9BACT|nr:ROK family protein [Chryseolinea lacunae]MBL0739654.1 ROK family protein [Chryseolinea lacunae]
MNIGVDLGGTNVRAALERNGDLLHPRKARFNNKGSLHETLDELMDFIHPLMTPDVKGIGIGVPSVVDVDKGIVFNVANIPAWERVPLKNIMEDRFHVPVFVNNDVNCFALGEHRFGVLRGVRNAVAISSGTGLGCGVIINHQLFMGSNCGAGEIGLLKYLDHNIEYYASGNLFRVKYNITGEEASQLALQGDVEALAYWEEFGVHMGQAIKSVLYTYDPEAIVLGGSLSTAYALFRESMFRSLEDFLYPESLKRLKLYPSQNPNVALLGAAALTNQNEAMSVL